MDSYQFWKSAEESRAARRRKRNKILLIMVSVGIPSCLALYVAASWWKVGADRSGCILNIRNIEQAVRGHGGMKNMSIGDPLAPSKIHGKDGYSGYIKTPTCPSGGTYTYLSYNPEVGELYCTCSHAKSKGHEPEDYSTW